MFSGAGACFYMVWATLSSFIKACCNSFETFTFLAIARLFNHWGMETVRFTALLKCWAA